MSPTEHFQYSSCDVLLVLNAPQIISTYWVMQRSTEALNPFVSEWDGICWSERENSLDGIAWLPSNQSPDESGELGNEQAFWQKREAMRSFQRLIMCTVASVLASVWMYTAFEQKPAVPSAKLHCGAEIWQQLCWVTHRICFRK